MTAIGGVVRALFASGASDSLGFQCALVVAQHLCALFEILCHYCLLPYVPTKRFSLLAIQPLRKTRLVHYEYRPGYASVQFALKYGLPLAFCGLGDLLRRNLISPGALVSLIHRLAYVRTSLLQFLSILVCSCSRLVRSIFQPGHARYS